MEKANHSQSPQQLSKWNRLSSVPSSLVSLQFLINWAFFSWNLHKAIVFSCIGYYSFPFAAASSFSACLLNAGIPSSSTRDPPSFSLYTFARKSLCSHGLNSHLYAMAFKSLSQPQLLSCAPAPPTELQSRRLLLHVPFSIQWAKSWTLSSFLNPAPSPLHSRSRWMEMSITTSSLNLPIPWTLPSPSPPCCIGKKTSLTVLPFFSSLPSAPPPAAFKSSPSCSWWTNSPSM